jgi:hypothetical protein
MFCLAVLSWEKGASRRARRWAGAMVRAVEGAHAPTFFIGKKEEGGEVRQ